MNSGLIDKFDEIGAQVRPFRFRLIRLSRVLMMIICVIAALASVRAFFNNVNARQIELVGNDAFVAMAAEVNLKRQSTVELEALAQRALDVDPPNIDFAAEANAELYRRLRSCLSCENRTVFIEQFRNGKLTDIGRAALSKSYQLSPYGDEELMKWRLEISTHHWSDLDEEQRKATLRQITALAQSKENREWILSELETDVPEILERLDRLRFPSRTPP